MENFVIFGRNCGTQGLGLGRVVGVLWGPPCFPSSAFSTDPMQGQR